MAPPKILKGMKPTMPVPKKTEPEPPTIDPADNPETGSNTSIEFVQPQAEVSKKYPDGTETTVKEDVGGPVQKIAPSANVGVNMGLTIQTAPYNNFKFSVSLFIPCAVDVDEINETYTQVKSWVESRVEEISDEINAQMNGGAVAGAEEQVVE